jgi:hypothetical protein
MVLKVVAGKIFKTLELWVVACCRGPRFASRRLVELRTSKQPRRFEHGQIVKERDYLLDNQYVFMLSKVKA